MGEAGREAENARLGQDGHDLGREPASNHGRP